MPQTAENDNPRENNRLDYDNLFKTVMHRYFWEGLMIFCPALYGDADTSQEPEFLEQELEKIVYDLEKGANRTDLLVRVPMKNGSEQWVLTHLEIQGEDRKHLPTRMNRYRAMIYLKYDVEPVAIAVLTAPRPKTEACSYLSDRYGTRVVYEYNNVDVQDLDDERLISGDNRIALILYAAKRAQESGDDEGRKFRYLRDISNIWAERGWSNDDKRVIMLSIEYLMNLRDPDYTQQMLIHFEALEKEGKIVEYATIAERGYMARGVEKGREEGRARGREEGRARGREEGKLEVARTLLKSGFTVDQVVQFTGLSCPEIESVL